MNILALDIGGTSIKAGVSDERGNLKDFNEYPTQLSGNQKNIVEKIKAIIADYHGFDAIGISTAGQVNSEEGYIIYYANDNIPNYTGTSLKDILEEQFNVPVEVENDVNAAALGEKYFGAGKKYENFLCLTFGTGIGGAIVLGSQLYKGHRGIAAEFGHMITHPNGRKCPCGRLGCYETYASTTALVSKAKEINTDFMNGKVIFAEENKIHFELQKVIQEWIFEVSLGLTSLIHIFNPSAIIIGGGVMEQEDLVHMVSLKVKELIMESFSDVVITKASLGNKAGMLGAALLHLQKH
ncbi:ROK family protein [Bacillus sp. S/N-304-OC-R1]|uniref:ROK family protein n=1 Tax=Bacillus sp. S/N-304-OC-R1 TaxID=2758034 RepID=UPI001C8D3B5D|nr:ROK family protein [Bacillus sp. S/N-304-OC-R1]MBY0121827.1 ROK family protein [Bacillus sp. S/N-304-OC-R1]